MRLYLSSYGLGENPSALVDLVGGAARAAVIFNARDAYRKQKQFQDEARPVSHSPPHHPGIVHGKASLTAFWQLMPNHDPK